MPTFDTPEPITATIDLAIGDVRISAGDRATTVVEVQPSDPSNERGPQGRRATRVEYANEQLLVKAPKLRSWLSRSGGGSIDVTIELPAGSHVHGSARAGGLPLRRSARRLPDQDRPRSHPARPGRHAQPEERRRRHQRRPCHGPRRGHGRLGRRAPARARRQRGDQELQRRHVGRRGRRRPAAQRGQRQHRRRPRAGRRRRQVRQRRRPARRGRARLGRARDQDRRPRGRHPRGHRRLARRELPVRSGAQRPRRRRRAPSRRPRPSRCALAPRSARS